MEFLWLGTGEVIPGLPCLMRDNERVNDTACPQFLLTCAHALQEQVFLFREPDEHFLFEN